MCNRQGEDGGHLFLKCKQAKALWNSAGMEPLRQQLAGCCTAKEVIENLLTTGDGLQLKGAFLLNNWWHERNRIREGEKQRSIDDIAGLCGRQATEIMNLQKSITAVAGP
jgi:hypothetical protein